MLYREISTNWVRTNLPNLTNAANLLTRTKYGTTEWHRRAWQLAKQVANAIIEQEILLDEAWVEAALEWSWDHEYRSSVLSGYIAFELKTQFKLRGWNF